MNDYDDNQYLEHIWVNIAKRTVKIMADDGVDEVVQWKFDEEGSEGFTETLSTFNEYIPEEMITYLP
tara:strand:- start:2700 stop:2900 length:201 start_codon:yes stop_codon:yes gene_type:complete